MIIKRRREIIVKTIFYLYKYFIYLYKYFKAFSNKVKNLKIIVSFFIPIKHLANNRRRKLCTVFKITENASLI